MGKYGGADLCPRGWGWKSGNEEPIVNGVFRSTVRMLRKPVEFMANSANLVIENLLWRGCGYK